LGFSNKQQFLLQEVAGSKRSRRERGCSGGPREILNINQEMSV